MQTEPNEQRKKLDKEYQPFSLNLPRLQHSYFLEQYRYTERNTVAKLK